MFNKFIKLFQQPTTVSEQLPSLTNLDIPLYFIHIPKTAGISFSTYLAQHMPSKESIAPMFYGDIQAIPFRNPNVKLFHGHIEYFMAPDDLPFRMITFLRDPVSRCISQYKHWNKVVNLQEPWAETMSQEALEAVQLTQQCSLSDFVLLRNPYIDAHISNLQTRFLATVVNGNYLYETSCENVASRFMFVGLTEYFGESITRFRSLFKNARPYTIRPENENRSPFKDIYISPKALDRLHELNDMDFLLYQQECRKFLGYNTKSFAA